MVDRFNNLFVTAFVTPGNTRFLLLHDGKNDDIIRGFYQDVYDVYLKVGVGGGRAGAVDDVPVCNVLIL